MTEAQDMLGNG